MKTQELLKTPESELAPALKTMKIKELEKHARKILTQYGCESYDKLMVELIKLFQSLPSDGNRFDTVKQTVVKYLNDSEDSKNGLERLTALITVLITKRFQEVHLNKSSDTPLH